MKLENKLKKIHIILGSVDYYSYICNVIKK
jgi:hypothetical protein